MACMGFLQDMRGSLAFRIQELGYSKLFLSHVESLLKIVGGVGPLQATIVHQIWPNGAM